MRHPVSIGSVGLGTAPRVVAIVNRLFPPEEIALLPARGADLLEMRIDLFDTDIDVAANYLRTVRARVSLPMIGTIRETPRNRAERLSWFEHIVAGVEAIDIEIDTPIAQSVIRMAQGKTVIVSEHDFSGTPGTDRLREIVERALALGADIVKIAATAHSREDVVRLLNFAAQCGENVVAISMGPVGTLSRIAGPLFGSLFTFGFLEKSVAPGQLSLEELVRELARYYPDFAPRRNPNVPRTISPT